MKYYGDDIAAGLAKIGGNITEESAKKHAPKLLKTATDGIAEGRKLALGKTKPIINWTERKVLKTNPLNDIGVRVKTQLLLKESLAKTFKISGTKLDEAVNLVMKSAGEAQGHQLGKH